MGKYKDEVNEKLAKLLKGCTLIDGAIVVNPLLANVLSSNLKTSKASAPPKTLERT